MNCEKKLKKKWTENNWARLICQVRRFTHWNWCFLWTGLRPEKLKQCPLDLRTLLWGPQGYFREAINDPKVDTGRSETLDPLIKCLQNKAICAQMTLPLLVKKLFLFSKAGCLLWRERRLNYKVLDHVREIKQSCWTRWGNFAWAISQTHLTEP